MASAYASVRASRIAFGLTLAWLAVLGCGAQGEGAGDIAVGLRWLAPLPDGPRGVLSGVVDSVRLQARRGTRVVVETACAYEDYACALLEVPAGAGYTVRAEGLAGGQAAFRGEVADVAVSDGEVAQVDVAVEPIYSLDVYAPAAVDDLAGAWLSGSGELELTWTSTGDDGRLGRAALYEIRWALTPLDEPSFAAGNLVDGPAPRQAGTGERLVLRGGLPSGDIHVRLRVEDGASPPNVSELSNEVVVTVP
jgi:hypothetical protein